MRFYKPKHQTLFEKSGNVLRIKFRLRPRNATDKKALRTGAKQIKIMPASLVPDGLKHWSCLGKDQKQLPAISRIKALHIYDFDNTLFLSPLPNAKLWTGPTIGMLQNEDVFVNGGWWHDNHLLEATGKGMDEEEARGWEGWWNEDIVKLVELSMRQDDALTILLTGRGENKFTHVIKRMVAAKKLEFDMVCLKPSTNLNGLRFKSTMDFKQNLIKDIISTYQELEELKIYEDRPRHTQKFREFLDHVNLDIVRGVIPSSRRKPLIAEAVQVPQKTVHLDPVTEAAEIQKMINLHNASNPHPRLQMKRTVFFTGYLLQQADTDQLISLLDPSTIKSSDCKLMASNIMISPRPATQSILDKVGGMGAKQIWQVSAIGNWNNMVWSAKVSPIPSSAVVSVDSGTPQVVLANLRGSKPIDAQRITHWQPVPAEKQFVFETTVGEKAQLRIEPVIEGENEYDSLLPKTQGQPSFGQKRKGAPDDHERSGREDRRVSGGFRNGRGGSNRDRGDRRDRRDRESNGRGCRGAGNAGRGREDRGPRKAPRNSNYRSLDEGNQGGYNGHPQQQSNGSNRYNENFPPLGGGPAKNTGGYDGADDGGLHY